MKSGNDNLSGIKKLLQEELEPVKKDIKVIKQTLESHTKTLDSHTKSLADIENRIIPPAKDTYSLASDHSKKLGLFEDRFDDLETRVDAVEVVVASK